MDEDIKQLVRERLLAMPPNVSFSIGKYGDFTRDQLLTEVEEESEIGKALIDMQIDFIRKMPTLIKQYG